MATPQVPPAPTTTVPHPRLASHATRTALATLVVVPLVLALLGARAAGWLEGTVLQHPGSAPLTFLMLVLSGFWICHVALYVTLTQAVYGRATPGQ